MNTQALELIAEYNLNEMEAKAFKVALMWNALVRQECANYRVGNVSFIGDPRKKSLFKYAYKLVTETKGLIPDNHYKLYILAQIRTLKQITDGEAHALIDPCALVGPKAWKRWRVWKEDFDRQMEKTAIKLQAKSQIPSPSDVKTAISKTKKYFIDHFGDTLNQLQIEKIVKESYLKKWIFQLKVSPFYAILSPFVSQALKGESLDTLGIETDIYLPAITQDIRDYFNKEFPKEFNF